MSNDRLSASLVVFGLMFLAAMVLMAVTFGTYLMRVKGLDRTVTVKGLSEREVPADIAIWPVSFAAAGNDLTALYEAVEGNAREVFAFLQAAGFSPSEITKAAPVVTDKLARRYGGQQDVSLRYTAQQTMTVYTTQVDLVRALQSRLGELGKKGIALGGEDYDSKPQFLFTKLNELKPQMIEEATRNARAVAEKFAADSQSRLGKIKKAGQGLFTIEDRDANTPHMKRVRVVSTVEYYLSD